MMSILRGKEFEVFDFAKPNELSEDRPVTYGEKI